jgi:hypothetical protein
MGEAMEFSKLISQSNMVPTAYKGKPADVLVAVQWGAELGLAPLQALQNIACINGKPSVYGDAALALVRGSMVCDDVEEYIEGEGEQMVATCIAKRRNCKPVVAKFSVFDAKAAGLWKKSGPWTQYPRRMLQMRARGFALRDAFPDVLKGLITAEEAQDYPRTERDITPVNPLEKFAQKIAEELPSPAREEEPVQPAEVAIEGEVIPEDVPAPETSGKRYPLIVPGGEVVSECATPDEWVDAWVAMLSKVISSKKYEAREKMTKCRELRECNVGVSDHLEPQQKSILMGKYQAALRKLGAMMNEAGEEISDAS